MAPGVGEAEAVKILFSGTDLTGEEANRLWGVLGIVTGGYGQKARLFSKVSKEVVEAGAAAGRAESLAFVKNKNPLVEAEKAALERIAQNPKGPDLSKKASNTILNTLAIDGLKAGKLPGTPIGGPGTPREMPASNSPNATAEDFVNKLFRNSPIKKDPISGCEGCWRAQTSDKAWVTYRPAGQASSATSPTTATVEINSPAIKELNANAKGIGQQLKLKFPEKSEVVRK